jgi:hypothetical protein
MRRATARAERQRRRYRRWQDLIAGAPSVPAVAERAIGAAPGRGGDDPPAGVDDRARD